MTARTLLPLALLPGLSLLGSRISAQRATGPPSPVDLVVYVDADAPLGGDGTSWATAFRDLQDGLRVAREVPSVRQVWIAEGTYHPAPPGGSLFATFLVPHQVGVYGGFDGTEDGLEQRDPVAHPVFLSGDLLENDGPMSINSGDNSHHVVTVRNADARLDGLTIQRGYSRSHYNGAGILATAARLELVDVTLNHHQAVAGAALYADGGRISLEGCKIARNLAYGAYGGGVFVENAESVTVRNSVFRRNDMSGKGYLRLERNGSITVEGSVFERQPNSIRMVDNGPCTIENDVFRNRITTYSGALVFASRNASLRILDSSFEDNRQDAFIAIALSILDQDDVVLERVSMSRNLSGEPVLSFEGSQGVVRESSFLDNEAPSLDVLDSILTLEGSIFQNNSVGPTIRVASSDLTLRGTTIDGNQSAFGGGGLLGFDSDVLVEDCTLSGNRSLGAGGAVNLDAGTSTGGLEVVRCRILDNADGSGPGSGLCGGIQLSFLGSQTPVRAVLRDSLFAGNAGAHLLAIAGTQVQVDSCTFSNDASLAGPLIAASGTSPSTGIPSSVLLRNGIVWGADPLSLTGNVTVQYSDVRGGAPGVGNLDVDPGFVSPGDPRLQPGSPCIDAGFPEYAPSGLDLEGDPRWLDGDLDGVLAVDMGYDEHDPLHLVVTPQVGSLQVDLTGPPGVASLVVGTDLAPNLLPGLGFLSPTPLAALSLPAPPSTTSLPVPGLPGPLYFQAIVTVNGGVAGTISNLVTLP